MTPRALLVGRSTVKLWGLDGATRLERQLHALGVRRVARMAPGAEDAAMRDARHPTTLLLRADWLFDDRLLRDLAARPSSLLLVPGGDGSATTVAAHVAHEQVGEALRVLEGGSDGVPGTCSYSPQSLSSSYRGELLKAAATAALPIRASRSTELERYLFDGAYKGVTDFVTKWVWPAPARIVTRICARLAISPNAVTAVSWLLAGAVTALFADGRFAPGLALGWAMTFLDTVDGKLARVTVTSTRAGHFFDHVLDLLHPPVWYWAWGCGSVADPATMHAEMLVILAGYVAGRMVEGCFQSLLADFPLFSWRPFDSWFRLVVARRNPNLVLLSAFLVAGRPAEGLAAVAAWTAASTLLLLVRLLQAALRRRRGELHSWLAELGADLAGLPAWARPFAADPAQLQRLSD